MRITASRFSRVFIWNSHQYVVWQMKTVTDEPFVRKECINDKDCVQFHFEDGLNYQIWNQWLYEALWGTDVLSLTQQQPKSKMLVCISCHHQLSRPSHQSGSSKPKHFPKIRVRKKQMPKIGLLVDILLLAVLRVFGSKRSFVHKFLDESLLFVAFFSHL